MHTCHVLYDRRKFEITNPPKTIVQIPQSDKQQQISFIRKYLTDHQIQIIIIQGIYDKLSYFAEAAHGEILIAYVFHGEPAFPYKTFTIDYICSLIKYRGRVSWGVHRLLKFPMRKLKLRYELYLRHKQTNQAADYFVFLSRYCANAYKRYSFSSIEDRSFVIPNSLSFDIEGDESIIKHKQKHVLLVARFEEFTKAILKINAKERNCFYEQVKIRPTVISQALPFLSQTNRWLINHPILVKAFPHLFYLYFKILC